MLRKAMRNQFGRWIERRIPPSRQVRLDQRRILVFPTAAGFLFLLLLVVLLITAINYQNNGIYALTFMLGGLFVVAILTSYANLSGLLLAQGGTTAPFAGEPAVFRILLRRQRGRPHIAVTVGWPKAHMTCGDLVDEDRLQLEIYLPAPRRGVLEAPRVLVESLYPFGLVRAWSWLDLELETVVYPAPASVTALPFAARAGTETISRDSFEAQEFTDIRPWRRHDTPRHVIWKAYAREQPLMNMEFAEGLDDEVWLDFARVVGQGREAALSTLSGAALQLAARQARFGLRLDEVTVAPGSGSDHLQSVLEALGRYRAERYRL